MHILTFCILAKLVSSHIYFYCLWTLLANFLASCQKDFFASSVYRVPSSVQ